MIVLSLSILFQFEINSAFIAAILTVLGYSINDTLVIFDRIRENIEKLQHHESIVSITNKALNQTLQRTINTSTTTLLVITALIVFGGTTTREFCLILLVGVIAGTYSSLCVASPLIALIYPKEHLVTD